MEDKLEKIIDSINADKYQETFRLESITKDSHILKTLLKVPINLNPERHYRAGLRYFSVYNFIVNITDKNNVFRYSHNSGTNWNSIKLPQGAFEIQQIDEEIKRLMRVKNHYDSTNNSYYINIIAKQGINKIAIDINNSNYRVDRNISNSVTKFFGFNNNTTPLTQGYHIAENQAEITDVFTIDLKCNIIDGGYVRGEKRQIIYDIPSFTVPIGAKIIEQPQIINYFPLNTTLIKEITIEMLDQDGNPLIIPGERKFASLKIEQV